MTGNLTQLRTVSRRGFLGLVGAGAVAGTVASWPRLTAADIPGRNSDALTVAILGTAQDAAARAGVLEGFRQRHPDIEVRFQAVQGATWGDFFAKLLTMVAAGNPPDVALVATEGLQLFAHELAEPLDTYVRRDAAELQEYFSDVHPALIESFLYEGNLYQLPLEFNAANMYLNTEAMRRAGVSYPAADWTRDDFSDLLRAIKRSDASGLPFYWVNRLWGGVVPWLYANGTSFLEESKAPGGDWLWERFYAGDPAAANRSGGYRWLAPTATAEPVVEVFDYLNTLIGEGLSARPEEGSGDNLLGLFASNRIAATPAGGFWVQGLADAGMPPGGFDVQYHPRWRTQRHQFGGAGYVVLRTAKDKDAAWEFIKYSVGREAMRQAMPQPTTTPSRRSLVTAAKYAGTGPQHWQVFYDTFDVAPDTAPIPAPPQYSAVEAALLKHVSTALSAPDAVRPALAEMQDQLALALGES